MKTSIISSFAFLIATVLLITSCSEQKPHFTIQGNISQADSTTLYLYKRGLTETSVIDSIKMDKQGNFEFSEIAPEYPEFYFLSLNNQNINIPIDSIETITVKASAPTFATEYTIDGSESANRIKELTLEQYKLTHKLIDLRNNTSLSQEAFASEAMQAVNNFKEIARKTIYSDPKDMAAYFALFQKVGDLLIFDPYEKEDIRSYQAVATAWEQFKPKSPRAEHVKNFTLAALAETRKAQKSESTLSEMLQKGTVDESTYYEINLPNIKGQDISLSSLKGKVVILDFTAYTEPYSPAHNIAINSIYQQHKAAVEVYQVSFDSDAHRWRNTAVNLPWICVLDNKSVQSDLISKFNIQGLPTTFLIGRDGKIAKRVLPNEDLGTAVSKLM